MRPLARAIAVWLIIIVAESISGTIRSLWLIPAVGEVRAGQIGFVVGVIIVITTAWLFICWMRPKRPSALVAIGLLWAALTLAFEVALGRLVLNYSWERMVLDYEIAQGGLMLIGLAVLLFAPLIAATLRGTNHST